MVHFGKRLQTSDSHSREKCVPVSIRSLNLIFFRRYFIDCRKNLFSLCAFSNAETFKSIDDADINYVEDFVRNELPSYFQTNPNDDGGTVFNEEDKPNFFGIYARNPGKFSFLRGERKLIQALVKHVKCIEENQKNLDEFLIKENGLDKVKVSWKGTSFSSIGMYFGEKTKHASSRKLLKSNSPQELKNSLYQKVKRFLESYTSESSEMAGKFNQDFVFIDMSDSAIKAEVQCIFCAESEKIKKISVYRQPSATSYCWILSNLKKHLNKHSVNNNKCVSEDQDLFENQDSHDDPAAQSSSERSHDSETEDADGQASQYEDLLYTQWSVQILKLKNAIFLHKEKVENIIFNLDDTVSGNVDISSIKSDGNCLFGAIAHQLFFVKLDSEQHAKLTAQLRKDVVEHITCNLASYTHEIKGRILESNSNVQDIDQECKLFLKLCLPRSGFWGGFETLKAITTIHKVNIIIFNENGDCYFALPNGFNTDNNRTISIAFRNANKRKRTQNGNIKNHYDSVVGMETEIASACSKQLIERMFKDKDMKGIIELDNTI